MAEINKVIQVDAAEWDALQLELIEEIMAYSKREFGYKFISRETGQEAEDDAIRGFLLRPVFKILQA